MIPETLRFTPVANINNEFNRRFTSIKSTSDSPIKTEEQLRLVLEDSKSRGYTLFNTNKCHGVLQPIANGVVYQIEIPFERGRGGNKNTHQQFYNGSHDLKWSSLESYLNEKIQNAEDGDKMGELGVAICAYNKLGDEDKAKLGPIKIRKLDSYAFPKNSYNFLGLKLLERASIADTKAKLLRNDICLNIMSPVRTAEEFTAYVAEQNAGFKAIRKASSTKKQAKHDQLTEAEHTRVSKYGKVYVAKTPRRKTSPEETAMIKGAIREINKRPNPTERTFANVARTIIKKSRKRGREEGNVAKEYVARVFVGSGNLTTQQETENGMKVSKFCCRQRKKAKKQEDWRMNK